MRTNIYVLSLALVTLFLAGCATNRVEADYGTSHNLAKFNQTLDPDADKNLAPVEGLDGRTAEIIVEKYQKSFEKPAQAMPTLTVGISGGGK